MPGTSGGRGSKRKSTENTTKSASSSSPGRFSGATGSGYSSKRGLIGSSTKRAKNDDDVFVVAKQEEAKVDDVASAKDLDVNGPDERIVLDDYYKVLQEEEKIYRGSCTFLKGTQSANPHNDYSQHYVDSGQLPANFIRDPSITERFAEYPKLKELIQLKDALVNDTATPPMYLQADLQTFDLRQLGSRFDVIIIEPPLPEYNLPGVSADQSWTWDMIEQLDICAVAEQRCFLWIWCGPAPQGTNRARQCLRRWGFRRCEDICWVKQNLKTPNRYQLEPGALFHRVKEHCLMGIKGTVRRSVDGDFIHANVDIDLIIEEDTDHGFKKPEEIFQLAERFCLGRRRLHLFARDDTLRPGWLSIGSALTSSNFDRKIYRGFFDKSPGFTTGCSEKIEMLRPKSPDRTGGGKFGGGGNAGGAGGGGGPNLGNNGPPNRPFIGKDGAPINRNRQPLNRNNSGSRLTGNNPRFNNNNNNNRGPNNNNRGSNNNNNNRGNNNNNNNNNRGNNNNNNPAFGHARFGGGPSNSAGNSNSKFGAGAKFSNSNPRGGAASSKNNNLRRIRSFATRKRLSGPAINFRPHAAAPGNNNNNKNNKNKNRRVPTAPVNRNNNRNRTNNGDRTKRR